MERFSGAGRALCVREFYKNGHSATVARRRFSNIRGFRHSNDAPSIPPLRKWVKKMKRAVQHWKNQNPGDQGLQRTVENVGSVYQSVRDDPNLSIRKRASALNVHRSSLHRILNKDLKLHPGCSNVTHVQYVFFIYFFFFFNRLLIPK